MTQIFKFPRDFLWGAATSSHQVEGDNRNNDWWQWETEGRVKHLSGRACDHYRLFKDDFKLAKELKHNAHRFSVEWSRIEPQEGVFDESALAHYAEVVSSLKSLNIEPVITLNHFTLPLWFYRKGGWLSKASDKRFASFADRTVRAIGHNVKYWLTINEPAVYAHASYLQGIWPPGHRSFRQAGDILIRLAKAHSLAYETIHSVYNDLGWTKPRVGMAKNIRLFLPYRERSIGDKIAVWLRNFYFNRFFIESLLNGVCAAAGLPVVKLSCKRSLDFLGVNYYTRECIHSSKFVIDNPLGFECEASDGLLCRSKSSLGWDIYPEGMCEALSECASYGVPLMVTENGVSVENDAERTDFIKNNIKEVARAMQRGANVFGYLYWSLMDNFEWAYGYGPRFGLIEVDYKSQRRTIRPSGYAYADIITNNAV